MAKWLRLRREPTQDWEELTLVAIGQFEGAGPRLGESTERTLSWPKPLGPWMRTTGGPQFVGTTICLGRGGVRVLLMFVSMGAKGVPPRLKPNVDSMRETRTSPSL